MKCHVHCTAKSYQLRPLYQQLEKEGKNPEKYDDCLSLETENGNVFFFSYGVVTFWGIPENQEEEYLAYIKQFEVGPLKFVEEDNFKYKIGTKNKIDDLKDEITLSDNSLDQKLAVSYALSQSAKLSTYEQDLELSTHEASWIPEELANTGKVKLGRREIAKKMGRLFLQKNSINLHMDFLDRPEFFWERAELEPLYTMSQSYLDLPARVEVLNKRLDMLQGLFEMLNNQLQHKHSSLLEWVIILLILLEVVLFAGKEIFVYF